MRHLLPIIALLCLLLSSCATQKQVAPPPQDYKTLTEKVNVTLKIDNYQYTLHSVVQMWRDELVVLSLQPVVGIEMFRIEATTDSILIVDKMNHRYTTLAYDWAGKDLYPTPSLKLIQDFVSIPVLQEKKAKNEINFAIGNHNISFKCVFSHREYDKLTNHRRIILNKYKRVTLREILPL